MFFLFRNYPLTRSLFCNPNQSIKSGGALNLDDMLSDLTSNPLADLAPGNGGGSGGGSTIAKRKRGLVTPQSARSRRTPLSSGSMASSRNGLSTGRGTVGAKRPPPIPKTSWTVRDYEDADVGGNDKDDDSEAIGGGTFMEDDSGEGGVLDDGSPPPPLQFNEEGGDAAMSAMGDEEEGNRDGVGEAAGGVMGTGVGAKTTVVGGEGGVVVDTVVVDARNAATAEEARSGTTAAGTATAGEAAGAVAKPRSRFARMKETNDISVTAAAEAALRPKPAPLASAAAAAAVAAANGKDTEGGKSGAGVGSGYMPSLDFQGPQYALSDAPSTPAGALPSTSAWLLKVWRVAEFGVVL